MANKNNLKRRTKKTNKVLKHLKIDLKMQFR